MTNVNRQWILKCRPSGAVCPEDFHCQRDPFVEPELKPGEILIHNLAFLCAPTIRNWMDPPGNHLFPTIGLGETVRGPAAARVIASANKDYPVGCRISTIANWQDYQVLLPDQPGGAVLRTIRDGHSCIDALGVLGLNALTAYMGLFEVGRVKEGETLLVSGAAGSVGSVAAQIGKIAGCRVIGIAGGNEKCSWLIEDCGIDACIDYKSESLGERLAEYCPEGINVFFDNVGGDTLITVVRHMARRGRIVLCGQISGYNDCTEGTLIDTMRLVYGGITMQGFLASMYYRKFDQALEDLHGWVKSGSLKHREDLRQGMENLPCAINALFDGSNRGTLIVQVDDEAVLTS